MFIVQYWTDINARPVSWVILLDSCDVWVLCVILRVLCDSFIGYAICFTGNATCFMHIITCFVRNVCLTSKATYVVRYVACLTGTATCVVRNVVCLTGNTTYFVRNIVCLLCFRWVRARCVVTTSPTPSLLPELRQQQHTTGKCG